MNPQEIKTLGELKKSGYKPVGIKEEIRNNLIDKLQKKETLFEDIFGYEDTVIPQMERALLAGHSINLLGLRGQGKTKMARNLVQLLDEYIPIVEGSEMNDDPLQPLSRYAKNLIHEKGDDTPIDWIHRNDRFVEKLSTPDVTIADLIGDIDPIKAANLKLTYSDERVIHFGLIPRSHRCIFVMNELPDLQPRIQVALFNILQEGDIQIRGFKLRLPLDIQFVFTANPEDYTNRGAIITPLKDRIQSQIMTHYPKDIELSGKITLQEAQLTDEQRDKITVHPLLLDIIENLAALARVSDWVDVKSGVSARLTISAFENLVAAVERRMLINGETKGHARISDLEGIIPGVIGKIELVYEGEQEGAEGVARKLLADAIREVTPEYFKDLVSSKSSDGPFTEILEWFSDEKEIDLLLDASQKEHERSLKEVKPLKEKIEKDFNSSDPDEKLLLMEFLLHALAEYSKLGKKHLVKKLKFNDLMGSLLGDI